MYKIVTALMFLALFAAWSDDATAQAPGQDRYIESSDAVGLGDVTGYGRGATFVDI